MPAKDSSVLNSSILATGSKFIVSEDSTDGTFGPGTTGYMAYVKGVDRDFPNVFYLRCLITRRGKGGKTRMEPGELSAPIFDFGANNEAFVSFMPDEKRKYYVHVEPQPMASSLLDMDYVDYLGWAAAYTQFMHKLSSRAKHFSPWPEEDGNVLNKLMSISDYWSEDPEDCRAMFCDVETREATIRNIRRFESALVKCALSYLLRVSQLEVFALKRLLSLRKNDHVFTDKKALESALGMFESKMEALGKLSKKEG